MQGARARRPAVPSELRDGVVTALSSKGAQGDRVAVYLDGKRAFDISALVAGNAGLRKDQSLTCEQQTELLREDEPYRARETALRMLARRDLTSAELTEKLRGASVAEEVASATVQWVQGLGYVDDAQYAAAYISAKDRAGWGRRRIESELHRKGVDRSVVDAAWEEWSENHDVGALAEQLAEMVARRFGGQLASDPQGAKRRISSFLARRGHDWDTISAVLEIAMRVPRGDPKPSDLP